MPLKPGKDMAAIDANVRELIRSGYPPKQAVAIAYQKAGKAKKGKKRWGAPSAGCASCTTRQAWHSHTAAGQGDCDGPANPTATQPQERASYGLRTQAGHIPQPPHATNPPAGPTVQEAIGALAAQGRTRDGWRGTF